MSFGQIVQSVFGYHSEGVSFTKKNDNPKQVLETAFVRFNKSIDDKNSSQKKLKKSVREWAESSCSLNECINECGSECRDCAECIARHREYLHCHSVETKDMP